MGVQFGGLRLLGALLSCVPPRSLTAKNINIRDRFNLSQAGSRHPVVRL